MLHVLLISFFFVGLVFIAVHKARYSSDKFLPDDYDNDREKEAFDYEVPASRSETTTRKFLAADKPPSLMANEDSHEFMQHVESQAARLRGDQ